MLTREQIHIRDPFILPVPEENAYYMYGTVSMFGVPKDADVPESTRHPHFETYRTTDLVHFEEPVNVFVPDESFWADRDFWAPEVHQYHGKYYMFASFKAEGKCRGTQILSADTPIGPFVPLTEEPVTPRDWECLDGTLYINENQNPWIVFCHEWLQIHDGTVCAMPLSDDLTKAIGEPTVLFHGSDPACAPKGEIDYITDGPFIVQLSSGVLGMLWSTGLPGTGYAQLFATSENGIKGPWKQAENPVFVSDGGHGMVFTTLDGIRMLALHAPNGYPEHPCFFRIREENGTLVVETT